MDIDTTTLIDDYFACWNATDAADRAAAVARTWTEEATSTDPANAVAGHDELTAMFAASQEAFPGHRFRQVGGADSHHQLLRWGWEMLDADGARVLDGIDVAIVADDGRLSALAGFFGAELPPAVVATAS
ncbi:MAG: nuclear transport factor 2 family protein [Actinomycetota bacterium]